MVQWPDACEEAFSASRASDDAGLLFASLAGDVLLVQVMCAGGSYQPSSMWFTVATPPSGEPSVRTLDFLVEIADTGTQPVDRVEREVFGEWAFDPSLARLTLLSVARQTADCGYWAQFHITDGTARRTAWSTMFPCPAGHGDAAQLDASRPPAGWLLKRE